MENPLEFSTQLEKELWSVPLCAFAIQLWNLISGCDNLLSWVLYVYCRVSSVHRQHFSSFIVHSSSPTPLSLSQLDSFSWRLSSLPLVCSFLFHYYVSLKFSLESRSRKSLRVDEQLSIFLKSRGNLHSLHTISSSSSSDCGFESVCKFYFFMKSKSRIYRVCIREKSRRRKSSFTVYELCTLCWWWCLSSLHTTTQRSRRISQAEREREERVFLTARSSPKKRFIVFIANHNLVEMNQLLLTQFFPLSYELQGVSASV